jgi:hypothetical protein
MQKMVMVKSGKTFVFRFEAKRKGEKLVICICFSMLDRNQTDPVSLGFDFKRKTSMSETLAEYFHVSKLFKKNLFPHLLPYTL